MADFIYDVGDEVKIIGDSACNQGVGKLGVIKIKSHFPKVNGYKVKLLDEPGSWNVYEEDLELMNAVGDVIPEETIKNASMANDPAYCNCNGPSELRRFDTPVSV